MVHVEEHSWVSSHACVRGMHHNITLCYPVQSCATISSYGDCHSIWSLCSVCLRRSNWLSLGIVGFKWIQMDFHGFPFMSPLCSAIPECPAMFGVFGVELFHFRPKHWRKTWTWTRSRLWMMKGAGSYPCIQMSTFVEEPWRTVAIVASFWCFFVVPKCQKSSGWKRSWMSCGRRRFPVERQSFSRETCRRLALTSDWWPEIAGYGRMWQDAVGILYTQLHTSYVEFAKLWSLLRYKAYESLELSLELNTLILWPLCTSLYILAHYVSWCLYILYCQVVTRLTISMWFSLAVSKSPRPKLLHLLRRSSDGMRGMRGMRQQKISNMFNPWCRWCRFRADGADQDLS